MMVNKLILADIYKGNDRVHELVDLEEAREFVEDKREDDGTMWALEEVEVRVFEVEYVIKDNMYGDLHRLSEDDFGDTRVRNSEVKVRDPAKWGNPSDGEIVHVASYKRYQGKPRMNVPAESVPNRIE